MSDSLNHDRLSDDLFRNRIAAALQELDQPESDADIAAALDAIAAEPLGDAATQRIMQQVQRSIFQVQESIGSQASGAASAPRSLAAIDTTGGLTPPRSPILTRIGVVVACAALVAVGLVFQRFDDVDRAPLRPGELLSSNDRLPGSRSSHLEQFTNSAAIRRVKLGETLSTGPREKLRVTLLDGSVLSINEQSRVTIVAERRVKLLAGEVFAEVVSSKSSERFVVETPHRTVTALGTKFVVKAQEQATSVVVTQGKVQVSGVDEVIPAGQELIADLNQSKSVELRPAKRSAYVVEWVKDLMASAGSIVVPASEHAGGTVTVVDPQGQEMKLSLRKFHVDVHIEEGFARTTIDQTYFNHTWQQLEGTFRFPLPADASLSRLAMYVNGKLMEGGMVERDYGRNVFEQIRHTKRDPALLEWVDGSTFQMRVFPLEPRQEKRIILSYSQRLPNDYGKSIYRFPAGHSLEGVREWSAHLRVKDSAGMKWYSPSHLLNGREEHGDLLIDGREEYAALDRDLVVELSEEKPSVGERGGVSPPVSSPQNRGANTPRSPETAWAVCEQDGFQYVMLRQRPELKANAERSQRQWIFLVENSADRNEVLAETQRQIAKVLLENAEHSDTFSIIRAGTQAESFRRKPAACSLENVAAAQQFLSGVAPIGALDLEQALQAVQKQIRGQRDVWIVHLGTGIPVLGERDDTTLLRLLPANARYVGVAVGKRWSKSFMETAANHSGGHVTQINPDEAVAWRAFDLLSTLNAPRLTEIKVRSSAVASESEFLLLTNSLAHGQELAAVARIPKGQALPNSVTITGKLNGKAFSQTVTQASGVASAPRSSAVIESTGGLTPPRSPSHSYLPRTWARLEIDRLVALGATEHKPQIIELSKAMYVMSPFTSLLVLETEAMYEQFKVDRGRKDHWAMYPAPAEIPVVADQGPSQLSPLDMAKERLKLSQARAKSAQSNYEQSVTEKRPAADLQRLERLTRAEQTDVRLIEREIQRIEQANVAAADPVRIALKSVVQRRSAWQLGYLQTARQHWNYWGTRPSLGGDLGWSSQAMNWSRWGTLRGDEFTFQGLSEDDNGNGNLDGMWLDLDLPAHTSLWSKGRTYVPLMSFTVEDLDSVLNLNAVGNVPGEVSGEPVFTMPLPMRHKLRFRGSGSQSVMGLSPNEVSPYFSTLIDGELLDEQRYLRVPILDAYDDYGLVANPVVNIRGSALSDIRRGYFAPIRLPGRVNLNGISDPDLLSDLIDERRFVPRFAHSHVLPWDVDYSQHGLNNNFLAYRGFLPSFHRPELLQRATRFRSWNGPDADFDGDGILDAIQLNLEPTVLATDGLPEEVKLRVLGTRGYVTNGGFMLPYEYDASVVVDGRHPTLYGRDQIVALHPLAGVLNDLPSYAPGLQTWPADRLAIVEQAAATKPQRGEVDPEARRLIEKARSLGWERCKMAALGRPTDLKSQISNLKSQTRTAEGGHPTVIADGSGRFVFDREVGEGLKETVINDGTTLWHLYPEIGLGAKRTLSRFHQSAIQSLIPWYVPSADDLSVEADVKTIGERTIRITRRTGTPARLNSEDGQECPSYAFDLIFAENGRLRESRVIDITANKVLAKQTLDADGTVRVFDAEDKLVSEAKYERTPIEAPILVPATKGLVVLPLPYRSAEGVPVTVPVNLQTNAPDFAKLSDDDALLLLASYFAEARPAELGTFVEQRFTAKGDYRIGLAVLLSSVVPQNPLVANATKQHPDSPLGYFLEQFSAIAVQGNHHAWLEPTGTSPFLNRLVLAYNHHSRWSADQAAHRDRAEADLQKELATTLLFIRECRSLELATKLLATVHLGFKRTERMNATFARLLNDTTVAIAEARELPAFARTARIEWLLTIGDEASVTQAQELFRKQLADSIATDGYLGLNKVTRSAFAKHFKTPEGKPCAPWGELIKEAARKIQASGAASAPRSNGENTGGLTPPRSPAGSQGSHTLIALARSCVSLSEPALAAEIFALAIKDQDLGASPRLNLAALQYALEAGHWEQAEACIRRVLADEKLQKVSKFWRDAAHIAEQLHKFHDWIEFLDRAYELEFAALPKTLDLNAFRIDYGNLFNQFDQRTAQLAGAKPSEKVAFSHIVQRAAARWRDIDVDDTVACHRTAFILAKLGLPTAAWNYWTTPLAETPDRSTVWQTFAIAMHAQQRVAVADQAWTTAFACEPTNPEILLQHAQFLRSTRQEHKARELLTKIVNNTWQPRFDSTKQQAQALLTGGGSPK